MKRYDGDLAELREAPGFDWSLGAMSTYLREDDLRRRDAAVARGQRLEAEGGSHCDVLMAYAAAETRSAKYPEFAAEYAAHVDRCTSERGLRGWHRGTSQRGDHFVQVNYLRTAAEGDVDRYYVHGRTGGGFFDDGSRFLVVDRDTGRTAVAFGRDGETRDEAYAKAKSWIYTTESGGC